MRNGLKVVYIITVSDALRGSPPIGVKQSNLLLTLIVYKVYKQESKAGLTLSDYMILATSHQENRSGIDPLMGSARDVSMTLFKFTAC